MHKVIPDLTPINGYLTFENGVRRKDIEVQTVNDAKSEDEMKFRIGLLTAKGGGRLDDTYASTTLTVLKSDNANGLFGFKSISALTITETSNISITVDRAKGTSGAVTIFFISPRDDQFPELDEKFVLKLVSAASNDGKTSSTPTSGASVDPNFTEINITVTKNDYPYGLLQFMDTVPAANATILPAVEGYRKSVRESSGTVDLIVVRAQGVEGMFFLKKRHF
ncbi:hypothetical protein QZH41_004331 [Actinostola sp. cb2023]|nr:hypothetical protein QZH41_004331 [Actinostola sp. cb2023]